VHLVRQLDQHEHHAHEHLFACLVSGRVEQLQT
jgi:hypothetical protein